MNTKLVWCVSLLLTLSACDTETPSTALTSSGGNPRPQGHGAAQVLGSLTVAGKQLEVVRLGDLVSGKEGAFEVAAKNMPGAELAALNVYLWLESKDGTQLSAPAKGAAEEGKLHFHVTPQDGGKAPFRVMLRVRANGVDERGGLPLDGHGHEHPEGPHGGVPAKFQGGGSSGHLELKLHDDKGDLELWLFQDERFTRPFDLPLEAAVEAEFIDVEARKVILRARNKSKNEDEAGKGNVRDGKTNYFVFPGETGESASWLRGKEFQSIVIVRFTREQTAFVSEEFVLKPHTH